MSPVTLW